MRFNLDLAANPNLKALYLDNEQYDGYFRDRCVFRTGIDIEDTMNVLVNYDNGVTMCYSLNAFNAWEGYIVAFNGTKGRLEHKMEETVYVSGDGSAPGALKKDGTYIRIFPLRGPAYEDEGLGRGRRARRRRRGHARRPVPARERQPDKYLRAADQRAGAYSVLIGAAANRCFETGQPVAIADLVPGIATPNYQPMPAHTDPVPMPAKRTPSSA